MKLGVQITETNENTDFAYLVTQLAQTTPTEEYRPTGGIIWVDRGKPNVDQRLVAAITDCLQTRFSGHRRK